MIIGPGITIQNGVKIDDGTPDPIYYPALGTKTPVLGVGGQSPFPAAGWISLQNASSDDSWVTVPLPFRWIYNGLETTQFFFSSNFYVTFDLGSQEFSGLGAAVPRREKIFFGGRDNSFQRVSYISSSINYTRTRYEGNNATSGVLGSPGIVAEFTLFNRDLTGGMPMAELLVGKQHISAANNLANAISGIYGKQQILPGGTIEVGNVQVVANTSYVFAGNSSGTDWQVFKGYYMGGTDY